MAKKPFQVIYDLYPLSNEERQAYLDALSEEIGLPVHLKGLRLIPMNQEYQAGKRLVAYAVRGITDLLREIHNISILGMTPMFTETQAAFIATGKNAAGRVETSVGSHSIEGLHGEKLASAIMTAETRAGRRVTLKFVGHGILDVTEVEEIVDLSKAGVHINELLDPIPAPQMFVPTTFNDAPGKDITEAMQSKPVEMLPRAPELPEEYAARMKQEQVRAQEFLKNKIGPENFVPISEAPKTEQPELVTPVAQQPAPTGEEGAVGTGSGLSLPPAESKPKRKYTRRKSVEIASPGQEQVSPVQTEMPRGQIDATGTIKALGTTFEEAAAAAARIADGPVQPTPAAPPPPINANLPLPAAVVVPQADPVAPTQANPVPAIDPEKLKGYATRFRKYSLELLPQNGLKPIEKMGINAMLSVLANRINDAQNIHTQNEAQWVEFLAYLDDYTAQHGIEGLVKHVYEVAKS